MAENPSVVQGEQSNYNIGRMAGETNVDPLAVGNTQRYIKRMQELSEQTPVTAARSAQDYYPTMGRSIQVGQTQTKTLGAQPLFSAGLGHFPFTVTQAFRKAKAEQAKAMMPAEMEEYNIPEVTELNNMYHQTQFNEMIKDFTDRHLQEYASRLGGDYMMAHQALKQDRDYQQTLKEFGYFANAYNKVSQEAEEILTSAQDPDVFVPAEDVQVAKDFVRSTSNIEDMSIEELVGMTKRFQKHSSFAKMASVVTDGLGDRITQRIAAHPQYNTNRAAVLKEIKEKGWEEEDLEELMDAHLQGARMDLNESDRKALMTMIKARAEQTVEETVKTVSQHIQDEIDIKSNYVAQNSDGNTIYGRGRTPYNTPSKGTIAANERVGIRSKVKNAEGYMVTPEITVPMRTPVIIQDGETTRRVAFSNPMNVKLTEAYNVDGIVEGELQIGRYYQGNALLFGSTVDEDGIRRSEPVEVWDIDRGEMIQLTGEVSLAMSLDDVGHLVYADMPGMALVDEEAIQKGLNRLYEGQERPLSQVRNEKDMQGYYNTLKHYGIGVGKDGVSDVIEEERTDETVEVTATGKESDKRSKIRKWWDQSVFLASGGKQGKPAPPEAEETRKVTSSEVEIKETEPIELTGNTINPDSLEIGQVYIVRGNSVVWNGKKLTPVK